mgnify:CR=1 FL=1
MSEALAGEVSYEARTNLQVEVYCEDDLDAAAAKQDDFEVYPLIHEKSKAFSAESSDPSAHSAFVSESTKSEGSCDAIPQTRSSKVKANRSVSSP